MSRCHVDAGENAGAGDDDGLGGSLPLSGIQILLDCCWVAVREQVRRVERRAQMVVAMDRMREEGQVVGHQHWAVFRVVNDCCGLTVRQIVSLVTMVGPLKNITDILCYILKSI